MRNVITASYLMNVGEINHWNALMLSTHVYACALTLNGLFKHAFEVATVQALLLWSSFVTDRRLLSKQLINFKFEVVIHHCHDQQATIVQAVFDHSVDLCLGLERQWPKASQ